MCDSFSSPIKWINGLHSALSNENTARLLWTTSINIWRNENISQYGFAWFLPFENSGLLRNSKIVNPRKGFSRLGDSLYWYFREARRIFRGQNQQLVFLGIKFREYRCYFIKTVFLGVQSFPPSLKSFEYFFFTFNDERHYPFYPEVSPDLKCG